jgi:hypothetical protein
VVLLDRAKLTAIGGGAAAISVDAVAFTTDLTVAILTRAAA